MKTDSTNNSSYLRNHIGIGLLLILIFVFSLGMLTCCGRKADKSETTEIETTTAVATTLAIEDETDLPADDEETGNYQENETYGDGRSELPDVVKDGTYDSKEEVAAYIVAFGRLPSNYITKEEARKLGWSGGSVERYAPGKCIGGDRFGNYEGQLPEGRYIECDIDTLDYKDRGSRRIVFSDDEIYYTHDHYRHFEKVCDR